MARSVVLNLIGNDRVTRPLRGVARELDNASDSTGRLSRAMAGLNKVGRLSAVAAAAPALTALTAAAVPAAAAMTALPAAMAASKVASATFKVGMLGVGEAMSQVGGDAAALDESLKKLSPNAAALVKQASALKSSWDGVQRSVQNRMFAGLAADLKGVAGNLLPTVKTGMTGVAGALNGVAREAAKTAASPWFKGQVAQVFSGTTGVVNTLSTAVRPLLTLVTRLAVAGLPLAQRMASWAATGVKAASAFVAAKQQSGALPALIQRIGDGFASLGRTGSNVARTVGNVVGQLRGMKVDGTNVILTIESISQKMLDWSRSAQGQQQMANTWRMLADAARQVAAVMPLLVGPLGLIAQVLTTLPAPVQGVVSQMIGWSIIIGVVGSRLKMLTGVTVLWTAATKTATGIRVAATATAGFAAGLRNVNLAYSSSATRAQTLGAALRSQTMLWRQQAAAARASAAATLQSARAATTSALATARQKIATVASTIAQRAIAVATKAWAVVQWVLNAAMSSNPLGLIVIALVALGGALFLAWKKSETFRAIVMGAFNAIKAGIMTAVNFVVGFVKDHWRLLITILGGPLGLAIALVTKYWSQIKAAFMAAVNTVIGFVRNNWRTIISVIGGPIGLAIALVTKHWDGIKRAFSNALDAVRSTTKRLMSGITDAFGAGMNAIGKVWDRLKSVAKVPVNFVIGTIYGKGIKPLVEGLAKLIGLNTKLPEIHGFDRGGVLPGYAPGRDSLVAAVSPGESIFRPEFTKAVGPRWVQTANTLARTGGPGAVRTWMSRMGGEGLAFARGGVVPGFAGAFGLGGIVDGFVKGVKDFTIGNVGRGAKRLLDQIVGVVPGSGMMRDVIAGIPAWLKTKVLGWIKDKVSGGTGVGGPGVQRALAWARSQAGKPYVWGGVGPGGYDCSGFMSAIVNVLKGRSPYSRLFTTFGFTGAQDGPQGFRRGLRSGFTVGVTNAGVGHMAGTLGGVNVESSGSAGVRVGGGARGTSDGLFNLRYGLKFARGGTVPANLFDSGGMLPTGVSIAVNKTGRPEPVFPNARSAARGGLGREITKTLGGALGKLIAQLRSGAIDTASEINSLFSRLNAAIKKGLSGAAERRMLNMSAATQKAMLAAATRAQEVAKRIADAKAFAADVASSARDFASLQNLPAKASAADILTGLQGRAASLTTFANQITQLKKKGIAGGLLQQIIGMGAGEGGNLARLLLGADPETFRKITGAQGAIDKAAGQLGNSAANALFDSGKHAGNGFLTGLYAQQSELNRLMDNLGRRLAGSVVGGFTPGRGRKGRGSLGKGVSGHSAMLRPSSARTVSQARPEPVLASAQATLPAGGGRGRGTLVEQHFTVYVTDRADVDMVMNAAEFRARSASF